METKQLYKIRTSRNKIYVDNIIDSKAQDSSWLKNFYFQSENGAIKYMSDYMKNTFETRSAPALAGSGLARSGSVGASSDFKMKSDPKIEKSVCGEDSTGNCYRIRASNSKVKFIVEPLTIFIFV